MEKKLHGEVAIVPGSDSGIGQATAIAFAREEPMLPLLTWKTSREPSIPRSWLEKPAKSPF